MWTWTGLRGVCTHVQGCRLARERRYYCPHDPPGAEGDQGAGLVHTPEGADLGALWRGWHLLRGRNQGAGGPAAGHADTQPERGGPGAPHGLLQPALLPGRALRGPCQEPRAALPLVRLTHGGPSPAAGPGLREGQRALQHRCPPHPDWGSPGPLLSRGHQPCGRGLSEGCCLLRENFSRAPSPDMSPASLSMLEQLMTAQAQECVFEGLLLPAPTAPHNCLAQLYLAQEAAQVAAEYGLAHGTMAQPPIRDYVPFPWTTLVRVKAEYFRALAHYHAAVALCDGPLAAEEFPALEQVFLGLPASAEPQGPALLQEPEERRKLGKAHLKRAILGQEEALRLHAVCRALRRVDLLQAVLVQALQRSLAKYSELDLEDDFFEATEAPDILREQPAKTHKRPEIRAPSFSRVKVADIFHRLGPLSVFSAKNRWRLVGPIHVTRGEGGFGFTLRGDSPVLIAAVVPGGRAAAAGLQEGDYIVSVNGQPCKWWKHAEVVAQLKGVGDEGASLQVVTLLPSAEPPGTGDRRPALGGLLRSQKECGWEMPAPARASPRPLLGWGRKAKRGKTGERLSPAPHP
ncbi:rhophilin-1 isoform X11 [Equus quagga]|uniref:rhophilin-1 isoform X11 n=1 Tax=Equus quagga TaxID=89248 RepID=UPI001EE24C74|nr:rhophilin-1 isoform X11 [Equus quagga]